MINNQISNRVPRLNPFVFPSDTDFRFVILIVATLSASISIYYFLYLLVPVNEKLNTLVFSQCYKEAAAAQQQNSALEFKAYTDMLTQCITPTNLTVVAWISLSIALLLSVAGALYWALPNWKIWRGGLKPLHGAHAPPDMMACLTDLCIEAGLSRCPTFLLNPYDMMPGGVTFGRLGRYFIALNSGLLMQFQTDPAVFRSIVLHELGHIRNADVDKTYFTVAIGWAFVLVALVPWIIYRLFPPWKIEDIFNEGWRILILTGLIYLTRNAILRTREVYADVRASVWDEPPGALSRVLSTLPRPRGGHWLHLLQVHPDPKWRRQALDDTSGLFRQNFWDVFVTGVVTASVISDIQFLLSFPFAGGIGNASGGVLGSGFIFAFLVAGIVGLGTWRATFANQVRGLTPTGTLLLSLGLGMGLLFGQTLSLTVYEVGNDPLVGDGYFTDVPSLTGLTWSSFMSQMGSIIFWSIVLIIMLWFFFKWVVACAIPWLKLASSHVSLRRIYWLALVVESIVLFILFSQLYVVRQIAQFAGDTSDPLMRDFYSMINLPDSVRGFAAGIFVILELMSDPLVLIALISLWAYPLAAWLWRKRSARIADSPWAFLDPSFHASTMLSRLKDAQERGEEDPSAHPRLPVSLPDKALFRPGLALGMGITGGLVFCGILVYFLNGIKLDLSIDKVIMLAVLVQVIIAAIMAGAVRQLSVVHGLFAAFVAGCIMTIGILVPGLFYSNVNLDQLWAVFREIVTGGALASLPIAFIVSLLANWVHRLFQQKSSQTVRSAK